MIGYNCIRKIPTPTTLSRRLLITTNLLKAHHENYASDIQISLIYFHTHLKRPSLFKFFKICQMWRVLLSCLGSSYMSTFCAVSNHSYAASTPSLFARTPIQVNLWASHSHLFISCWRSNDRAFEHAETPPETTPQNTRYPDLSRPSLLLVPSHNLPYTHKYS